ncbi:MAG: TldD/PmbA family protein [Candidatus Eremiobacteraeota bacterium]|nr:TldD/PmbA family protein [Candidatus Eremiobacteraeota bacterium]
MDELAIAERVVRLAMDAGASEAEATYTVADRFSAEARGIELVKLEQSVGRSIALRVFVAGAKASLGTSDLSADGLRDFVRETVEAARFVAIDPHAGLPDRVVAAADDDGLQMYADDVRARPAEAKIDDALALERLARAADERIINSSGSRVADSTVTLALANSKGFAGSYRASQASLGTGPIARDGDQKRIASYGTAARSYAGLEDTNAVAAKAVARAVGAIGARKPQTARCAVIFERDVAALVLSDVFNAANAASVAVGNSFLAGKIGARIGSELVTIVDDGRLARGLGTSPFDAEGVRTRRNVVVERGELRTFLFDTYYARRLGAASTGNASGGGIGPNNFYLVPGERSVEEVIAATSRGAFITDTIGFSTESVTGTYSRGARGFWIEGGQLAYPIDEFTIAGNLLEMLAAVDAVASDLVYDQPIVSPSFRVAEMTVSGS